MKNAFYLLLCTVVLGCVGGRSVNTTVHKIEPLRPIPLDSSPLAIKPLALNPPKARPAKIEPTYKGPDIVLESAKPNHIPVTPVPASGTAELTPIRIKPIDIIPIQTPAGVLLPELKVEQIELKEIEIPKPVHIKVFQLIIFYIIAGGITWLVLRWWNKRKSTKTPVKRKRRTRKRS
ncbi:hypothetical protein H8E06_01315 [bacterium]|nr:hypothetical protein [bacterium]